MNEHDIVPPIQPNDFIDPVKNEQQAMQSVTLEDRQQHVGIKEIKNKNNEDILVVVAEPKPVSIDLEKDLLMKEKRRDKGVIVD
ncbi:hypothetical protein [Candidatus Enterococcus murrayae]|uniref:Uncharacterized protein n=1 Tax=Candidatus Enterococcus murrayae TaxID=2815321 RepID=A0ABS3HD91_9ENTE|nr:hypothetical protein [Enterococcus sp. MJM16]MBO0451422.1 hypothetical protein [Enterococcus sp. MJM16]